MPKNTRTRTRGPQNRQDRTRQKIAAQRRAQQRAEARRRMLTTGTIIVVVLGVIGALVAFGLNSNKPAPGALAVLSAPSSLVRTVENVPAAVSNSIGAGTDTNPPKSLTIKGAQTLLTKNGLPEVLYMGAEYCPYCGEERWAMIQALSRFGTFSNLHITHSALDDGHVPTWTFYQSSFKSKYISFVAVEEETNTDAALQTPTPAQAALVAKYDSAAYGVDDTNGNPIPFIDFGNQYMQSGASYVGGTSGILLSDTMTWQQIANDLSNASSAIATAIDGTANVLTAAICKLTNGQPGNVCSAPGVVTADSKLPS
jgi:hypothetical protein